MSRGKRHLGKSNQVVVIGAPRQLSPPIIVPLTCQKHPSYKGMHQHRYLPTCKTCLQIHQRYINQYKKRAIKELQLIAGRLKHTPSALEFSKLSSQFNQFELIREFGSWNNALQSANLPVNYQTPIATTLDKIEGLSHDQILALVSAHIQTAYPTKLPTSREWDKHPDRPASASTMSRMFGTYHQMLKLAGHPVRAGGKTYTSRGALSLITQWVQKHKITPNVSLWQASKASPSVQYLEAHFGSFANALDLAGLNIENAPLPIEYSKQDILLAVEKAYQHFGRLPNWKTILAYSNLEIDPMTCNRAFPRKEMMEHLEPRQITKNLRKQKARATPGPPEQIDEESSQPR